MSKKKTELKTPEQVIAFRRRRLADQAEVSSFVQRFILLILIFGILFGFVFGIRPMANADMAPRISAGDLMLFFRLDNNFHNGDVVMVKKNGTWYTSRIVAQGGDTVEITDDAKLKVNGSIVVENDIYYITPQYESDVTYPLVLADNEFFLLCDYREGAKDSRYFGAVKRSEIKGKVITVIRRSGL